MFDEGLTGSSEVDGSGTVVDVLRRRNERVKGGKFETGGEREKERARVSFVGGGKEKVR